MASPSSAPTPPQPVLGRFLTILGRFLTFLKQIFDHFPIDFPPHFSKQTLRHVDQWRGARHFSKATLEHVAHVCAAPVPRLRVQSIEASLRISANRSRYEARFQPDIEKTNFSVQGGSICLTALLHGTLTGNSVHFLYGSTLPPYILCTGQL